ncbi:hypothetical protein A6A03_07625 [Chloroflexus islandicus]|uniref:Carboxypeptidase regulatory-like domain-containing protein n=1 Tax=Chloroflexus islandicus TaxID=1707952 RepID=A0A178MKQ8_9CHLR|nr:hypothetical protein [Chloroflexus islandicus]OAN48635.1 hypothetical protein A6A03_07625 [Chloroflexus islandicus]
MQRRMMSYSMMICGVIAMVIGFTLLPLPTPSTAAPALQPSPRPTIAPVTIVPASSPPPVPMGRVTGTIIDLRTNAPAAQIAVKISDAVVYSDQNGNYDRWVESGFYTLALQLTDEQGSPAQAPLTIAVGPGDTVVAHLFFTSPGQAEPAAPAFTIEAPTAVPTAVPTIAPVAVAPELPAVIPPKLPYTGVVDDPAAATSQQPAHLPRTATTIPFNAQFWFVVGFLLLAGGLGLQFWPSRRQATPAPADEQFLAKLLSTPPPATDEELLHALLTGKGSSDK